MLKILKITTPKIPLISTFSTLQSQLSYAGQPLSFKLKITTLVFSAKNRLFYWQF